MLMLLSVVIVGLAAFFIYKFKRYVHSQFAREHAEFKSPSKAKTDSLLVVVVVVAVDAPLEKSRGFM